MKPTAFTHNGALAYEHTEDFHLEFFSKAGSIFGKKQSYYGGESTALELFKNCWRTGNYETSMKLLFWLRDIRGGGAGNRSGFRSIINWLATDEIGAKWLKANIEQIPELGRWDDLIALYDTDLEKDALRVWAKAIKEGNGLACKWADRQDNKLRKYMKFTPKQLRVWLKDHTDVVEQKMCANDWDSIEYNHVPSVALGRYNKAFNKHDEKRFTDFRNSLVKVNADGSMELAGDVKAGAIFPHDLVRTAHSSYGDGASEKLVEGQFLSMPDLFNTTKRRILPFLDFSGSMTCRVSGSVTAMDVALGLGLYCSDRLGKKNPFYRKVVPFSSTAHFESWEGMSFMKGVYELPKEGYCGSTNIKAAFDLILKSAQMFKVEKEKMPNVILIISDQQFDSSFIDGMTPVESCIQKWVAAGYDAPEIVYWNVAGYAGSPATKHNKHVGMVSGFSPAILSAVLEGGKFDPISIMNRAIEKYEVKKPVDKKR